MAAVQASPDWMQDRNQRMSLTEYWTGICSVSQVLGHKRPAFSEDGFGQAFEGMHIMLFLALSCGQTSQRASAQIQDIEMSGGMRLAIQDGFMSGGLVPVTVSGIKVKIIQLGEQGQFIGQNLFKAVGPSSD
jgi:hypothetical protein